MKAVDQLQHGQHLAGPVLKLKFQKDHRGRALPVGQVAHGPKLPLHAGKLVRRALHLDEENVHIHSLVVAHARNVRARARMQRLASKSAHAVGMVVVKVCLSGLPSLLYQRIGYTAFTQPSIPQAPAACKRAQPDVFYTNQKFMIQLRKNVVQ